MKRGVFAAPPQPVVDEINAAVAAAVERHIAKTAEGVRSRLAGICV